MESRRVASAALLLLAACRDVRTDVSGPGGRTDVSGPGGRTDVSGPGGRTDVSGPGGRTDVSGPGVRTDVSGEAGAAEPPARLRCLAEHYGGRPELEADAWGLRLPDGRRLAWDDGRPKTMAQRTEAPDLEDMLAVRYPTGAIAPVTSEGQDPGRARVESLFRAAYGATPEQVSARLVTVKIAGSTVRFHEKAAPALARVATRIDAILKTDPSLARFFRALGGTFNPRAIAGTDRASAHSWGIAIDIDTSHADYWRNVTVAHGSRGSAEGGTRDVPGAIVWRNRIPPAIVLAFEAEGFVWGGRWFHFDTMHFEYRPELLDPRCGGP